MSFNISTTSGYRKLIDFKDRTMDSGLYNLSGGVTFYDPGVTSAGPPFAAGVDAHLVLTRDGTTNEVVVYVDGVEQITFIDSTGRAVLDATDNIIRFFMDDLVVAGEASAGVVDRIRIYAGALSDVQVAALFARADPVGGP